MTDIRHIHRYMTDRREVVLADGRRGKIVRVDTQFPSNETIVSVWTEAEKGPGVSKISLDRVVGPAEELLANKSA